MQKVSYLFSLSNRRCFSASSPEAPPANGDANPTTPKDENEGRGEPTPVMSVTRPVVGVCTSPIPNTPSDPERSSSGTAALPRDEYAEDGNAEVLPIRVFDSEYN
jgi:hypothetical protein